MHQLSNDIINLSLEKDTKRTPTKNIYYLFKDGKIIDKGNFKQLKQQYDKITNDNKAIIEKATKEFREKPIDNKQLFNAFMDTIGNEGYLERKNKKK